MPLWWLLVDFADSVSQEEFGALVKRDDPSGVVAVRVGQTERKAEFVSKEVDRI